MKGTRTCIACKKKGPKEEFIRIVADKNGDNIIDYDQKINARGVYICNKHECFERILKMKDISKILKIKTTKEKFINVICELGENIH